MEDTKEVSQDDYISIMDTFFSKNYALLLATFLEEQHDKFMEHIEQKYEDHKGQDMKW